MIITMRITFAKRETIPTKKKSRLTWQVGLMNLIWDKWHELWKIRNTDVQGKDQTGNAAAEKRKVTRRLNKI